MITFLFKGLATCRKKCCRTRTQKQKSILKKKKKLCTHKKRSASTCPAYLLHSIRLHDFITKIG